MHSSVPGSGIPALPRPSSSSLPLFLAPGASAPSENFRFLSAPPIASTAPSIPPDACPPSAPASAAPLPRPQTPPRTRARAPPRPRPRRPAAPPARAAQPHRTGPRPDRKAPTDPPRSPARARLLVVLGHEPKRAPFPAAASRSLVFVFPKSQVSPESLRRDPVARRSSRRSAIRAGSSSTRAPTSRATASRSTSTYLHPGQLSAEEKSTPA